MPRRTRTKKVREEVPHQPKAKFLEVARAEEIQQQTVPKLVPATDNQRIAVSMLREGKKVIVLKGSAGTGKSLIAAWWAATQLKAKVVDKVWLVRPAVPVGNTIGLLKGSEIDKLAPFFIQTITHLETFMGAGFLNYCMEKGKVEMKAVEYLRGYSFENCVVISEESQNFTASDLEMVVTRLGKNSTLILTGDEKQNDLKGKSGLNSTVDMFDKMLDEAPNYLSDEDLEELNTNFGVVTFTPDDCVRGGLTKAFVKMYYNN